MQLKALRIWETQYDIHTFKWDDFKDAFNKACSDLLSWDSIDSRIVHSSYWILKSITDTEVLDFKEQLILACLETRSAIEFICQWERSVPNKQDLAEISFSKLSDLILTQKTHAEIEKKLRVIFQEVLQENADNVTQAEINLLHTINATHLWIYSMVENSETTYYVVNSKEGLSGSWFVVDRNWDEISHLDDTTDSYCLVNTDDWIYIYGWCIADGYTLCKYIKGGKIVNDIFCWKDIISIWTGGIFELFHLQRWETLLEFPKSDFSWIMESWKRVDVHEYDWKYVFIYKWYNLEKEKAYLVVEDDLIEECFSSILPVTPIMTSKWPFLVLYDPEKWLYWLADISWMMCGTIVSFVDENDNHFIWWNFPDDMLLHPWSIKIRFVYKILHDDKVEYDTWFIFTWISFDTSEKEDTEAPIDLLSVKPFNTLSI